MGRYNSENTKILATCNQNGNMRMLLLHERDDGSLEYIIGSYFRGKFYDGALGYERIDYEWDWGHYFNSAIDAVDYWKNEVMWFELGEKQVKNDD